MLLTAHHLATMGLIVAFGMEVQYLAWQRCAKQRDRTPPATMNAT